MTPAVAGSRSRAPARSGTRVQLPRPTSNPSRMAAISLRSERWEGRRTGSHPVNQRTGNGPHLPSTRSLATPTRRLSGRRFQTIPKTFAASAAHLVAQVIRMSDQAPTRDVPDITETLDRKIIQAIENRCSHSLSVPTIQHPRFGECCKACAALGDEILRIADEFQPNASGSSEADDE